MRWLSTGHMETQNHLKFQYCVQKVGICISSWFQSNSRDPMGLGSIPSQRESELYMRYGQKWKRESTMSKKLKIMGYSHPDGFLARE